jgi:hypothetical protein
MLWNLKNVFDSCIQYCKIFSNVKCVVEYLIFETLVIYYLIFETKAKIWKTDWKPVPPHNEIHQHDIWNKVTVRKQSKSGIFLDNTMRCVCDAIKLFFNSMEKLKSVFGSE